VSPPEGLHDLRLGQRGAERVLVGEPAAGRRAAAATARGVRARVVAVRSKTREKVPTRVAGERQLGVGQQARRRARRACAPVAGVGGRSAASAMATASGSPAAQAVRRGRRARRPRSRLAQRAHRASSARGRRSAARRAPAGLRAGRRHRRYRWRARLASELDHVGEAVRGDQRCAARCVPATARLVVTVHAVPRSAATSDACAPARLEQRAPPPSSTGAPTARGGVDGDLSRCGRAESSPTSTGVGERCRRHSTPEEARLGRPTRRPRQAMRRRARAVPRFLRRGCWCDGQ